MGSVKDIIIGTKPTQNEMGKGIFIFSDRYSVFDWGRMPDTIENKGPALNIMAATIFEAAEKDGINTPYLGVVLPKVDFLNKTQSCLANVPELTEPTNLMQVQLVNVVKPEMINGKYNYQNVHTHGHKNVLIPLEVIYRNSLPKGSSVFRRLKKGQTTYQELGLDHMPVPGEILDKPILDVSTKLEETGDRYMNWNDAAEIAGLSENDLADVKGILVYANNLITKYAEKIGLYNADGKIELAYDDKGNIMLVDVLGTLDECRFLYQTENEQVHVSKQVARDFYKTTSWYDDVMATNDMAKEQGIEDWRSICPSQPKNLPGDFKKIIENMYMATANEMSGNCLFEAPPLQETINNYINWKVK